MVVLHIQLAWIGVFLGGVVGVTAGLFFHQEKWLGGYQAWPRRMVRLAHISFFGLAILNFGFASSLKLLDITDGIFISSRLFIAATVAMPMVCFLSAYQSFFRYFFFIPAGSILIATALFIWRIIHL
ncbi:MAG: hypothetical protein JW709_05195 [Sedimentisphaerales bacterium]|nr:hypothetical protein [Sedimentisphaerales bacterium]